MRATGSGVIGLGMFQMPVSFYKASKIESVRDKLHTACACGSEAKQTIVCTNPECGAVFTSWWQLPNRVFDAGAGMKILLAQKEIDEAKGKGKKEKDTMEIEKIVSLQAFATRYILTEPFYVLPPEKAVSAVKRTYRLLVVALASDGKAMLTRMTSRGNTKRIAIIADPENGILMGYEVQDAKKIDREVAPETVDDKLLVQARSLLAGLATDDTSFVADSDPVEALLSAKIDEMTGGKGIVPPTVKEGEKKEETEPTVLIPN